MRSCSFSSFQTSLIFGISLTLISTVFGQWSSDPAVNTQVCENASHQVVKAAVHTSNGIIVGWLDDRDERVAIFVQRFDSHGIKQWANDGLRVISPPDPSNLTDFSMVSDGADGAIIAWSAKGANDEGDVYTQRIDGSGSLVWNVDGVLVCEQPYDQIKPKLAADGRGGAFVAWLDYRNSGGDETVNDIYVQRIDSTGSVFWQQDGIFAGDGPNIEHFKVISNDRGEMIIVWQRYDVSSQQNLLIAQKVGNGNRRWPFLGIYIGTTGHDSPGYGSSSYFDLCSDFAGGAIIAWQTGGVGSSDIHAERIMGFGTQIWGGGMGLVVNNAPGEQVSPQAVADGYGGAVIAWEDYRDPASISSGEIDIYAQRIESFGELRWAEEGLPISTAAEDQRFPVMAEVPGGRAVIAWRDGRDFGSALYAQIVSIDTGMPLLKEDGTIVSSQVIETDARVCASGTGGAYLAWTDMRAGSHHAYMQSLDRYGYLGDASAAIVEVSDIKNDQGGAVSVKWNPSPFDAWPAMKIASYEVWRGLRAEEINSSAQVLSSQSVAKKLSNHESLNHIYMELPTVSAAKSDKIYWEYVGSSPAPGLEGYSYTVPTSADSFSGATSWQYLMVSAQGRENFLDAPMFWHSQPDSGFSVDNLSPATPGGVNGLFANGVLSLNWSQNSDADFQQYLIYKSNEPSINPDSMQPIATTADTLYVDAAPASGSYYFVCAQDIHDNLSGVSAPFVFNITGVQVGTASVPQIFELRQNYPNPFNPTTVIEFTLPKAAYTTLVVYNLLGEEVRTLVDGTLEAGKVHSFEFDASGVPSGLYYYRLRSGEVTETRKMMFIR